MVCLFIAKELFHRNIESTFLFYHHLALKQQGFKTKIRQGNNNRDKKEDFLEILF